MFALLIVFATVVSLYFAARSHLRYRAENDVIYERRFNQQGIADEHSSI